MTLNLSACLGETINSFYYLCFCLSVRTFLLLGLLIYVLEKFPVRKVALAELEPPTFGL